MAIQQILLGGGPKTVTYTISDNTTNFSASTAFGSDWTGTAAKTVVINSGVTVGATTGVAFTIEANMGGSLIINNSGSIQGFGGAANGGTGGNAVKVLTDDSSNITLNNLSGATIYGGGGGGGQGGSGGAGGAGGTGQDYKIVTTGFLANAWGQARSHGGGGGSGGSGGSGGAGGVGQGYNQSAASGSSGASGGSGSSGQNPSFDFGHDHDGTGNACRNGDGACVIGGVGGTGGNGGAGGSGGTGGAGTARKMAYT